MLVLPKGQSGLPGSHHRIACTAPLTCHDVVGGLHRRWFDGVALAEGVRPAPEEPGRPGASERRLGRRGGRSFVTEKRRSFVQK